jgi:hypothetical protein
MLPKNAARRRPARKSGAMAHNRTRTAEKRERRDTRASLGTRMPGLRWVPVPLAVLVATLGWLVLGGALGQHAAASDHHSHGYQAGGLELTVQSMLWLSNDMSGQGPVKNKNPHGYTMPSTMMAGMQTIGDNRLNVEVRVTNVTSAIQRYTLGDFRVIGPGGKSYPPNSMSGSSQAAIATLPPGFGTVIDLAFDIPAKHSKNLIVQWSHGGTTVDFPVNTSGAPSPHHH